MGIKKLLRENRFELVVFLIISLLMLPNFSNMYLWDDEGETAMLAKNILLFGIPKYYDGKNFVGYIGEGSPDFIWAQSSWLHLYITALSFSIFGFSTFSARLVFVIIGMLSFFPIVALFRKISVNKMHYCLSVLFLLFFVPYYLYSRQARYYALLIFLVPIIAISIYNLSFKNGRTAWFILAFVLVFYSNYLSFFAIIASASMYFFLMLLKKQPGRMSLLKKLIISYTIIFFLTFPWAVHFNILTDVESSLNNQIMKKIDYLLHGINSTAPLLLLIASSIFVALLFYFKRNEIIKKQKIFFTFFNGVIPIAILLFPVYGDVRYLIGLFPLWLSFILLPVVFLMYRKEYALKIIGAAIFLLLLFTNIFYSIGFYFSLPFENYLQEKCASIMPEKADPCKSWVKNNFIDSRELKYPFFYYLYEITHDYDGPIEGVVKYLKSNGNENSIVFANNWYSPIQFYTNMKVLTKREYQDTNLIPDFIVVNFPDRTDVQQVNHLVTYAEENNYTKITLPYPDLPWENRPVIWYHKFWTQPISVPATIYAK